MSEEIVESGISVMLNYTGKFEDGVIFDSSVEENAKNCENYSPQRNYEPLMVKVGAGQVIKGFDNALVGMKVGEKKEVLIPPEEGYGNYNKDLVQTVPIEAFKTAGITPSEGQLLNTSMGMGTVSHVDDAEVKVDFNSPLAGKTLIFEITVEDIIKE